MKTLLRPPTQPSKFGPADTFVRPMRQLEGLPIFAYGASYESTDSQGVTNGRAVQRLKDRHRMGALTNHALAGSGIDSMAKRVLGNGTPKWTSPTKGLVWFNPAGNSLFNGGYISAAAIAAIQTNTHACLCTFASASRVESSAATKSAGWTTASNAGYSGGSVSWTTTTDATIDYTVAVNATGIVDVVVHSIGSNSVFWGTFPGSPFTIWVDGVQYGGTYYTYDHNLDTANAESDGIGRLAVTLTGLTPGNRVIRVKKESGGGATYLYSDCVLVRATTPPTVLLFKQAKLDWAYLATLTGLTLTDAEVLAANAWWDEEAARFLNVIPVDIWDGFDHARMLGADKTHPNDLGQLHYVTKAEQALRARMGWNLGTHTGV